MTPHHHELPDLNPGSEALAPQGKLTQILEKPPGRYIAYLNEVAQTFKALIPAWYLPSMLASNAYTAVMAASVGKDAWEYSKQYQTHNPDKAEKAGLQEASREGVFQFMANIAGAPIFIEGAKQFTNLAFLGGRVSPLEITQHILAETFPFSLLVKAPHNAANTGPDVAGLFKKYPKTAQAMTRIAEGMEKVPVVSAVVRQIERTAIAQGVKGPKGALLPGMLASLAVIPTLPVTLDRGVEWLMNRLYDPASRQVFRQLGAPSPVGKTRSE
jgi:hypothetical protein